MRIVLLTLCLLPCAAWSGCAHPVDPAPAGEVDPLLSAAIAAQGATLAAMSVRDQAGARGDIPLCLGASGLVAGLPVASAALLDLHTDGQLDAIPAVTWDGAACLGEPQGELDPTAIEARVAEYVSASMATLRLVVDAHAEGPACGPLRAALAYVEPLPGAVVAVMQGAVSGGLPSVGIAPCAAG